MIQAVAHGVLAEEALVPLADVVAGRALVAEDRPRVFKCVGMSWQDLAVAAGVLEAADTP